MRWFYIPILSALILVSCADHGRQEAPPTPQDPARAYVEQLIPEFDEELREFLETETTGRAVQELLDLEAKRSWRSRINGGIKYADLFQELYLQRGFHKAFARHDGLRARGRIVLDTLGSAGQHTLDPSPYHVARIRTLDAELSAKSTRWDKLQLTPQEVEVLVRLFETRKWNPASPDTRAAVFQLLASEDSPLARVKKRAQQFREKFHPTANAAAELELRVADGALRYARDMKHFNLKRMDWRAVRDAGGGKEVIYARLGETFTELSAAKLEDVEGVFDALQPPHPQYKSLVKQLARYREIAASGGWPQVKKTSLDPGTQSDRIRDLRERLHIEGFLAGPPSAPNEPATEPIPDPRSVTPELVDAVRAYQETHQLRVESTLSAAFWRSLNTPVSRRIQQIETTLERWRESLYEGEPDFVFVNIPDFHAEVYEGGERALRFRVVVGNTKRKCDPKTKKRVYPNATPIQVATLDHLIINPFWNVPQRVLDEEIQPAIDKNPDYLTSKNYEWVGKAENRRIRQRPGEGNALGKVKFIFPNRHNTYMHDTPSKKYFDYPIRAFSHGCVRVQNPIDLAKYLISKDKILSDENFLKALDAGKSKKFELKTKMPVFFEYYVVKVDDQGRANFLADIYRLDLRRLSDDPEAFDDCNAPKSKTSPVEEEEEILESPTSTEDDFGP